MNSHLKYYSAWVFFVALAFDAKGDEGGGVRQYITIFFGLAAGFSVVFGGKINDRIRLAYNFGFFVILHLALCIIFSHLNGIDIDKVLRISINYVMFLLGFLVTVEIVFNMGLYRASNLLYKTLICASMVTIFDAIASGLPISDLRYSLVSPAVFLLVAISCYRIIFNRSENKYSYIILFFSFIMILLSATRNLLASFIIIVFAAVFLSKFGLVSAAEATINAVTRTVVIVLSLLIVMFVFDSSAVYVMYDRIFSFGEHGFDITSATRLAEVSFQFEKFTSSPWVFVFGAGLGAEYGFSGEYASFLYGIFGAEGIDISWWAPGHNFWMYSLFSQGVFLGAFYPCIFIFMLIFSINKLNNLYKYKYDKFSEYYEEISCLRIGILCLIAILTSSIGGNPLGPRNLSAYAGVASAFCYIGLIGFNSKN